MYERLDSKPGTFALKLGESLTKADIEQLYVQVAAAFEAHPRLNYFVDATAYVGSDLEARMEDLKGHLTHLGWLSRFDRVALVTDNGFLRAAAGLADLMTPVMKVKAFPSAEATQALDWCENG